MNITFELIVPTLYLLFFLTIPFLLGGYITTLMVVSNIALMFYTTNKKIRMISFDVLQTSLVIVIKINSQNGYKCCLLVQALWSLHLEDQHGILCHHEDLKSNNSTMIRTSEGNLTYQQYCHQSVCIPAVFHSHRLMMLSSSSFYKKNQQPQTTLKVPSA